MDLLSIPQRLLIAAVIVVLFYFGLPFVKDLYDGRVIEKNDKIINEKVNREIKKSIENADAFIGANSSTDYVGRVLDDGVIKPASEGVSGQDGDATLFEETPDADADSENIQGGFSYGELGYDDQLLFEQGETSVLSLASCGWMIIDDELVYGCGDIE